MHVDSEVNPFTITGDVFTFGLCLGDIKRPEPLWVLQHAHCLKVISLNLQFLAHAPY